MSSSSLEGSGKSSNPSRTSMWQVAHKAIPPQVARMGNPSPFRTSMIESPISVGMSIFNDFPFKSSASNSMNGLDMG